MTTLISIPQELTTQLEAEATKRHQSLNELVVDILVDALHRDAAEERDWPSLEEVITKIKATPLNPTSFHPATASTWRELLADTPGATFDSDAWNEEWAKIEQEINALDRADDIAEGRS